MPTPDPNQNHEISLVAASDLTHRYQESEEFNGVYGGFFGKNAIQEILDQQDCVGIRYYYGLTIENQPVLVLVGVTADNVDMVGGKLAELSLPCPDLCDNSSQLKGS
jgi:hypothetical protein